MSRDGEGKEKEMTASERAAALRFAIREELLDAAENHPEAIREAADAPLKAIAAKMDITLAEAFELHKACRKHIHDQWTFEDEGGVGQEWNKD